MQKVRTGLEKCSRQGLQLMISKTHGSSLNKALALLLMRLITDEAVKHFSSSGWHSSAFISKVQVCALSAQSHDCLCLLLCSSYSCMQHYFNVDAIQRPVSSLQAQLPPKSTYKRGLVHKILVHLSSGNVGSVIPMLLAIACRKVWNMWMFTIANIAFKTKRIELIRKPIGRGKIGCVRNRVNVLA